MALVKEIHPHRFQASVLKGEPTEDLAGHHQLEFVQYVVGRALENGMDPDQVTEDFLNLCSFDYDKMKMGKEQEEVILS